MINVGSQLATSQRAVEIADQYSQGVYAAVGLHPIHVLGGQFQPEEFNVDGYQQLINSSKKVVALGETGIDFYHLDSNFEKQKEVFVQHIDLAIKNNLALVIHARNSKDGSKNAYRVILDILKASPSTSSGLKGVIHCFGGSLQEANEFLQLGFYVGFTGIVTFKNAKNIREVAENIPLDSMLIETDSPYLAPDPHRSERNIPQYVEFVAKKIAEIKNINFGQIAEQTSKNAKELFGLNQN